VEEAKSHLNEAKEEEPLDISSKAILMAVSNRLGISPGKILGDSQGKEVSLRRGLVV